MFSEYYTYVNKTVLWRLYRVTSLQHANFDDTYNIKFTNQSHHLAKISHMAILTENKLQCIPMNTTAISVNQVLPKIKKDNHNVGLCGISFDTCNKDTRIFPVANRGVSGPWGPQFCGALYNGETQRLPAGAAGSPRCVRGTDLSALQ